MRFQDLSGKRFTRLVVLRRGENKFNRVRWWCRCDCGKETLVYANCLNSGTTLSCGCLHQELRPTVMAKNSRKHGQCGSPEHRSWIAMWQRVSQKRKYYQDVTVCERWKDFNLFLEDMGPKPTPRHSIDRYPDRKGNYEPGNCRWATGSEQRRNQTR